ncbi:MAG: AMP-binding protein, partial [Candidatus Acidiferrum sp.]
MRTNLQSINESLAALDLPNVERLPLALAVYFARLTNQQLQVVAQSEDSAGQSTPSRTVKPAARVEITPEMSFTKIAERITAGFQTPMNGHRANGTGHSPDHSIDALEWIHVVTASENQPAKHLGDAVIVIAVAENGSSCEWHWDAGRLSSAAIANLTNGFAAFCAELVDSSQLAVRELSILSTEDRRRMLVDWNANDCVVPNRCIHQFFADCASQSPNAPALVCGSEELTYRQLETQSNRLAHHLRAAGVGPDVLVGLCVERSADMVVAMLGILKAGGAYVPLDPSYPADRVAFMLKDSAANVLITEAKTQESLGLTAPHVVLLDEHAAAIAASPSDPLGDPCTPENLAYVLYTSGSTGKPKGVMVRHRNVVNFFAGMDQHLGTDPGVWLAVTSLSFDISVLELLWTLCRGYKVVLHTDQAVGPMTSRKRNTRPLDFSLMFFASAESAQAINQ